MSASIDGVVSGMDTTAIINATIAAAAVPMRLMEAQLADWEGKKSKVAALNSNLADLASSITALATPENMTPFKADFADQEQFTIAFGGGTSPGTYRIQVHDTAQAATTLTDQAFATRDTPGEIATGTFDVMVAGALTTITVDAGDTLETIAGKVNAIEGVTSYVLDTGATTPYKLVISGEQTGSANTLWTDTSGLTGPGTAISFTAASSAQDAHASVNGISIFSETNTFSDTIPGMTLDALSVGTSEVLVNVSMDTEGIAERVTEFVDAYNDVRAFYDVNTVYNADEGIRGALVGDSSTRRVMDALAGLVSSTYYGDSGSGSIGFSLSQMGILTTQAGTLEVDDDVLENTIATNFDALMTVFVKDSVVSKAFAASTDPIGVNETLSVTADGRITEIAITASDTIQDVAAMLNGLQGVQARVIQQGTDFRLWVGPIDSGDGTFGLESDTTGPTAFLASMPDGSRATGPLGTIVNEIETVYVEQDNGILQVRGESIESTIESLEERIEAFQRRMDSQTERLRAKFTQLEITMGQLQQSQGFLSALGGSSAASLI